jgi:hypothetical protein
MIPTNGSGMSLYGQSNQTIPSARILQKTHLRLLWSRAKTAGFTKESIWRLLRFLGIDPYTMSTATLLQLMPYINEINARKFSEERKSA